MLFVMDATPGVFESNMEDGSLEDGVRAPTKELLLLMQALGIKQVCWGAGIREK